MVHLPTEILDKISWEVRLWTRLASLATVNRHWQGVVERHLWSRQCLRADRINDFIKHIRSNPLRARMMRSLALDDIYFQNPSEIEHNSEEEDSNYTDDEKGDSESDTECEAIESSLTDSRVEDDGISPDRDDSSIFSSSDDEDTSEELDEHELLDLQTETTTTRSSRKSAPQKNTPALMTKTTTMLLILVMKTTTTMIARLFRAVTRAR